MTQPTACALGRKLNVETTYYSARPQEQCKPTMPGLVRMSTAGNKVRGRKQVLSGDVPHEQSLTFKCVVLDRLDSYQAFVARQD